MASDKIIAKIIENAEKDASSIRQEAQQKAEKIIAKIDEQTEISLKEMEEASKDEIEEIYRRNNLMTRLDNRKRHLSVKQRVMDETFQEVRKSLNNLSYDQWENLITKIVIEGATTGNEELKVPAKDREIYQNKGLLTKLNKDLVERGLAGNLSLCKEDAEFKEGVCIVGERFDIDGSFDALIDNARIVYEREVADILFPSEV